MIKENYFDTFRIVFDNKEELCMIARNSTSAYLLAAELNPGKEIVNVQKIGLWEDDDE